ncbi:hypothetical protein DPMN_035965 [Dreissena polymorpha]|uniref:Sushi domain-containing protein n=1 Tax=Dreissena polymorpha TaxID=45954 RepID=A0A9D4CPT8_DREPO|nr:hypothetical protein DPMN_054537 [Dreissena polymorpha]KAH3872743.1 hypothetical protein DPMN_035965 [Dreissena polymorpha]
MTLTCATGYAFHLRQLANGPPSVNLRCGYGGQWEGFLQTPRCTRKCDSCYIGTHLIDCRIAVFESGLVVFGSWN